MMEKIFTRFMRFLLLMVMMTLLLAATPASADGPSPTEDGWCAEIWYWIGEEPVWRWVPCDEESPPWDPYECGEIGDCDHLVEVCLEGETWIVPSYTENPGPDDEWYPGGACPVANDCYALPNSQVQDGVSFLYLGTGNCYDGSLRPVGGGSIVHFPGAVTREKFDLASGKWWYRVYFGGGAASDLKCKDYRVGVFGQGGGFYVLGTYNPCD